MMTSIRFVIAFLLFGYNVNAQSKLLTIEEAMLNARTTLAPENLRQLQFIRGGNDYVYLKKVSGIDTWVKGNFVSKEESPFLSLTEFNQYIKAASLDTVAAMPSIQFYADKWVSTIQGKRISINPANGSVTVLVDKNILAKENVDAGPGGFIAYVDNHNLFVTGNGNAKQVTEDGSEDIIYASSVHQSEFGINKGTFWSNAGKKLAFYRMDQHMVPEYPIIDWSQRPAKYTPIRYPMAGDSSHHVRVAVYHTETGQTTWLQTSGPKEQYLTNIAWSPDDKYVYIAIVNRAQDHMWLNQYDAASGRFIKTLFEESHNKYVEPLVPMLFVKNNPSTFIWQSRRDGWNHLYLYDITGKLIRQLTSGNWEVTEVKGFDDSGNRLFFTSTAVSPISRNLYVMDMKKLNYNIITSGAGVHTTQVSSNGDFVIDNVSNTTTPRLIQLVSLKKSQVAKTKNLLNAANPLAEYKLGELSIFSIPGTQGADLYCRMYKPINFDESKKYPVVVYWYGGPHAQLILDGWNGGAGDYWFQYMAQQGYLVFTLDTRGSANRGREFEQAIFRAAGQAQMEDMNIAVAYLKKLPFADTDNMGLFGWSYGGFMTTSYMLNHPGVFKAAVAGGPVMDWKYYEIMYTERYMDTPQENPDGYEKTNLVKQAGKLKGKLLLIHGMQDPVVVQQHSVQFVRAAIDKSVQVDYMIYPGHEHNVLGKDRVHLYKKVSDYLMQHLK